MWNTLLYIIRINAWRNILKVKLLNKWVTIFFLKKATKSEYGSLIANEYTSIWYSVDSWIEN